MADPRAGRRSWLRRTSARTTTVLAFLVVWAVLAAPDRLGLLTPSAFVRIPLEGLVLVGLALVLPARPRRVVVVVAGVLLAALAVLELLDMGFHEELGRRFDPVADRGSFGPAIGVLRDSFGRTAADVAVVGAVLIAVAVVVVVVLSVMRVGRVAARRRAVSARTVGALAVAWLLAAVLGLQVVPGTPLASRGAAGLAVDHVRVAAHDVWDGRQFRAALDAPDPAGAASSAGLLTGLRGKDVIIAFVESYGRVAVHGSSFSPGVDTVLNGGTATLAAAGWSSRSAFLTSPTYGGISWLAHSTLQSGLWVDNQQRYDQLLSSDRFTLSDAFGRAGWRVVADVPSNTKPWPQGAAFYHYATIYDGHDVGYAGPKFSYASMPDQYTLAAFARRELAPGHPPVMAEIDLVSSHTPFTPLPHMIDWNQVGDGSVYDGMPAQGVKPSVAWRDPDQVRALYGQSIEYSLSSLISFVTTLQDDDLVLVLLGDHQPGPTVSGHGASHDVPITIVAHDPAVVDRVSSWGWEEGMLPSPAAVVWPMDCFRNRFLTAFGPRSSTPATGGTLLPH